MASPRRVVILGAAGRDFHNFNTVFRDSPDDVVVAFTATQIPNISGRAYPAALAGPRYPHGIPIVAEAELSALIERERVDVAVFAYSDVPHVQVMHVASQCLAAGADFLLQSAEHTMLRSSVPVIAVTAVRTGAGKSQTTRYLSTMLRAMGKRVVAIRQEREEYEPHIDTGAIVYAGVDYAQILAAAEQEADVILWDGGNNDLPFYRPDLHIVVADPLRAGDESRYHPGETNVRMADVVVVNKCDSAPPEDVVVVEEAVRRLNPSALLIRADSPVTLDNPAAVRGRDVVVVEDGPTLTHGSMSWGAGVVGARAAGAASIVDPSPYAVGSLAATYRQYPNAAGILPAMGYGAAQVADLAATIEATPCDAVVSATPIDLTRVLSVSKPLVRARYDLREHESGQLERAVRSLLGC